MFTPMCPYIKNEKRVDRTRCECCKFTFPDAQARRELLYGICASKEAWKDCIFKKTLDNYYERKYNNG